MSDDRQPEPWERLEGETSLAYEAFRRFRDLGAARALRDVGGKMGTLRGWSARYHWPERAKAWDAETHRLDDARRLDRIRQMDETHAQVGRAMIAAGLTALRELATSDLTPHQAARLLDIGTRMERAALVGDRLPPPLAAVDEDESPLERIARELADTA